MDTSSMTSGSSSDATSVLSEWPSQDTTDSLGLRKRSPSVPSVSEGHKVGLPSQPPMLHFGART